MRVTTVLKMAGLVDTSWFTDYARDKGTAVHKACEFLDQGDLDWESLDPAVRPRVEQYAKFLKESGCKVLEVEKEVESEAWGVQGRLDRIVELGGRAGVLDIKGPGKFYWQAIQVAMYSILCGYGYQGRWTLHLSDDTYRLVEHKDFRDYEIAKAAITIAKFKELHGVESDSNIEA